MQNHDSEEYWIKPREWAIKASDHAPRKSEIDVASIVDLASISIPAINENGITVLGGNGSRVVKCLPG